MKGEVVVDAQDILEQITIEQIYDLLSHLGGEPRYIEDGVVVSKTICHGGSSHKLYYYENASRFTCYTGGCGYGFSVFDLIMNINSCSFIESLNYVKSFFGIVSGEDYISQREKRANIDFFKKFNTETVDKQSDVIYNDGILNNFYNIFHQDWINDGISAKSMQKYNIKYSILTNQIVIPHYNADAQLVGVRVRNLDKDVVDRGQKYMPLIYNGEMYNHDTGRYLYGLNVTKKNIEKHRKIILFEGEKSCMQLETMFPDDNISVALSGSNLSKEQFDLLFNLGVEEVIIALDKEFINIGDKREVMYQREIRKGFIDKILPYCKVSLLWDWDGLLSEKDSPSDRGKDIFLNLYKNRLIMFS